MARGLLAMFYPGLLTRKGGQQPLGSWVSPSFVPHLGSVSHRGIVQGSGTSTSLGKLNRAGAVKAGP